MFFTLLVLDLVVLAKPPQEDELSLKIHEINLFNLWIGGAL